MEIKIIASGSSGNCYQIRDQDKTLMIECGIPFQKIREGFEFKLSEVSGCIISHCHKDHCKSTPDLLKSGIDCYMSEHTKKSLGVSGHRVHVFKSEQLFKMDGFRVLPFPLEHNVENYGFLVMGETGKKLCYITDTFYCRYKFLGVSHFMLEANYNLKILDENIKSGIIRSHFESGIIRSHFEIENVKKFFLSNDLSKCETIHLIHMSKNNSDKKEFKKSIQEITGKEVYYN